MAYVKGQPFIPQFIDPATGLLMTSGTIEFYLTGTSTPTPYYTDSIGTSGGTSLTLNAGGKPSTDIYFDTGITYKLVIKNAAGSVVDTIDPFVSAVINDSINPTYITLGGGTRSITADTDSAVVARTVSGTTDTHGFADETIIDSVSDAGTYGSFDCTVEYSASGTIDHLYCFQGRGKYSGSGTLANYASFYHQPALSTGNVTDMHGLRIYDNTSGSTITNQHGVHIRPLSGGVNNYAIFSWGTTPSIHVGKITVGTSELDTSASIAVKNITNMTGVKQSAVKANCGGNSAALTDFSSFRSQVAFVEEGSPYSAPIGSGFTAENASIGGTVTLDAQYGFWARDLSTGTVNAAIRSEVSASPQKWGLYFTGTAQNYLNGKLGMELFTPTAKIDIKASDGAVNNAPLKLRAGVNLTTPEDGAFEFDGTNLYFTVGGVRKTVTLV